MSACVIKLRRERSEFASSLNLFCTDIALKRGRKRAMSRELRGSNLLWGLSMIFTNAGLVCLVSAILAAKWASDLGFRQTRQLLWGIAGLLLGPVALLLLYVRFVRKYQAEGLPAGRW
jgi:hypothetical protein